MPSVPAESLHGIVDSEQPTVLVVGAGDAIRVGLEGALQRHRILVERADVNEAVQAAFAAAPDLLLLVGEATEDAGVSLLQRLAAHPATSVVPVALLTDRVALDARYRAFRHGAVAVVPRTASIDEMARRIAALARELPERSGEVAGELGEATVEELVELLSKELRTGIVSVTRRGKDPRQEEAVRFVLQAGKPVQEAVQGFVERILPLVSDTDTVRYEFQESPAGRLQLFDHTERAPLGAVLERVRVLLVENSPTRADQLAQELRARGALVAVIDDDGSGIQRADALDPDVVMIDESGLETWGYAVMRALRRHSRLRWASVLVLRWKELSIGGKTIDGERLVANCLPLLEPDRDLTNRARMRKAFDTRLEVMGPCRMLRALVASQCTLHVVVRGARATVSVDLAEGLIVGAKAICVEPRRELQGPMALAALLALSGGRVRVETRSHPSLANVMAPVDDAIAAALREECPIATSLPPPTLLPAPVTVPAPAATHSESVLIRLREFMGELQGARPTSQAIHGEHEPEPVPQAERSAPEPIHRPSRPPPASRSLDALFVPAASGRPARAVPAPVVPGVASDAAPVPIASADSQDGGAREEERTPSALLPALEDTGEQTRAEPWGQGDQHPLSVVAEESASSRPSSAELLKILRPQWQAIKEGLAAMVVWLSGHAAKLGNNALALLRSLSRRTWIAMALTGLIASVATAAVLVSSARPSPPELSPTEQTGNVESSSDSLEPSAEAPQAGLQEQPAEAAALDDKGATDSVEEEALDEGGEIAGSGDEPESDLAEDPELEATAEEDIDPEDQEAASETSQADPADADGAEDGERDGVRALDRRLLALASHYRRAGRLGQAESTYLRILRGKPNHTRALAGLTLTHLQRRDSGEATRWARRLVQVRPQHPTGYVLLGDARKLAGDKAGARRAWMRALRLSPRHRGARRRLSEL